MSDPSPSADYFPNTFQTPNAFVDDVMQWLTGNETKILFIAAREILGWKKKRAQRRARISLSRFCHFSKMNRATVIDCLARLCEANILIEIGDWNNDGQMYELNLGQKGKYNLEYLTQHKKRAGNPNPAQARDAKKSRHTPDDTPTSGGNGSLTNRPPLGDGGLSEYTGTGLLNRPEVVYSIDTTKLKTQKENIELKVECVVWGKTADKIRLEMGKTAFENWSGWVEPVSFSDGVMTLKVKNSVSRDWIYNRLSKRIERALGEVAGEAVTLSLVV